MPDDETSLVALHAENTRLIALLESHGIEWRLPPEPEPEPTPPELGPSGFDHPPLDTLILAMPISWKGTLQQYAGRLHREHAYKTDVRIIDFMDTGHPALVRMWDKRERGYRAMGYRIAESPQIASELKEHIQEAGTKKAIPGCDD